MGLIAAICGKDFMTVFLILCFFSRGQGLKAPARRAIRETQMEQRLALKGDESMLGGEHQSDSACVSWAQKAVVPPQLRAPCFLVDAADVWPGALCEFRLEDEACRVGQQKWTPGLDVGRFVHRAREPPQQQTQIALSNIILSFSGSWRRKFCRKPATAFPA